MDLSNENVIHIKRNGLEYLQFKKLLEYEDLTHAYSLGLENNFQITESNDSGKYTEKETIDYKKLCDNIGSNYTHLIKPNQHHTNSVKIVNSKEKNKPYFNMNKYYDTDGLITKQKNVMLATTNADCILLLFYDPVKKVIANTHSGWRGTVQRISVETVKKMKQDFNCNPQDIICCICPSIRKCHFEVDRDVKEIFKNEFKDLENINEIIEEKIQNKKWNIDTVLINKILLTREGLKQENIIDSKICSVCNSDLIHSYRAEKNSSRNTALIEIRQ